MKKFLSLLLALAMVFSLAACGSSGDNSDSGTETESNAPDTASDAGTEESDAGGEEESTVYTGPDWEAIDAMSYDDASDAVYDWDLGEFYESYETAKEEVIDLDRRMALMAMADAKLMESGVFVPVQSNGGSYALSAVVPRTATTTSWGVDEYRWYTVLVCNELLLSEDRTALTALWGEAADADSWIDSARAYLDEHGYTLKDSYNFYNSYELSSWDTIASSYTSDAYFVAPLWSPLMEYDVKNVQQPALAESYEVSDDGLTYTFHIRQGVNWVDQQGRVLGAVTANDWVTSVMHLIDNNDALGYLMSSDGGCGLKNYDAYINGECSFEDVGVKALDDYTLEYTLEAAFPPFLSMLGYSCFCPLYYDFYKSQGGTFSVEGDEYTAGTYGQSPSNIAYCGAYLITNYTAQNVTSYTANPEYWNAENVNVQNINILYTDGSDVMLTYNGVKDGTVDSGALNSSSVVQAQQDIPDGETESYFDLYQYVSATDATTFCGWINLNRAVWTNYNDESKGVSPQSEEDHTRTRDAVSNQNFRLAVLLAFDRGAFLSALVGEDLKYASMRNSFVPGTFQSLSADLTIEINGESTTFPAGTYFGEIEQAQLDADGVPITVWDPNGNDGDGSGDGFDGWYNADNAVAYMEKAVAELAQIGVEVSAENPIYLDAPMRAYDERYVNELNAFKQSIENVLGGKVIINLISYDDSLTIQDAYYRINNGNEANYDIAPSSSGWGPDYGDAQTYLDTIQPYGYMVKSIGLY